MPKGGWGQSDLGEAEDRLRSQLALEGRVPVELEGPTPKIVPVMIVGDGTRPGMGRSRDRRFWTGVGHTNLASGTIALVQATQNIVIEQAVFAVTGAGSGYILQLGYYPIGSTLPGPVAAAANPFIDRGRGDLAPVAIGTAAAALTTVLGIIQVPSVDSLVVPVDVMIEEGACFAVRGVAGSTGNWAMWLTCRTF